MYRHEILRNIKVSWKNRLQNRVHGFVIVIRGFSQILHSLLDMGESVTFLGSFVWVGPWMVIWTFRKEHLITSVSHLKIFLPLPQWNVPDSGWFHQPGTWNEADPWWTGSRSKKQIFKTQGYGDYLLLQHNSVYPDWHMASFHLCMCVSMHVSTCKEI